MIGIEWASLSLGSSDSEFSPLGHLVILVLAVFESPVHDVADHRGSDQTQKLQDAKD